MFKSILPFLLFICLTNFAFTQQECKISGYIIDEVSRTSLEAANIFDIHSQKGTVSDSDGHFNLSLNCDKHTLTVSFIGYESQNIIIDANDKTPITIALSPSVSLSQVEITAVAESNIAEETQVSTVEVPIEQIKKLPAFLGETDVIKAIQLLPGVQSGGEGQSGLYVRGGSPDQNLILMDGTPLYNVSHLFGFFSVFNSDVIEDVKLIKAGYPARYGGRLSSVLDIKMKDGDMNNFHGSGSIGIIASSLTLEGPIIKDKTSFIISGRRTYIDLFTKPLSRAGFRSEGLDGTTGYFFHDINAKIKHKFSDKDQLFFTVYNGEDRFHLNTKEIETVESEFVDSELSWGNTVSSLKWRRQWNNNLSSTFSISNTRYNLITEVGSGTEINGSVDEEISLKYSSGINDYGAKLDFSWLPNSQHSIKFGIGVIQHKFNPGVFDLKQVSDSQNIDVTIGQDQETTQEVDLYIEDDFKINEKFKINAGLHASSFHVNGTNYLSLQPRISGRYLLSNRSSLKASFATMRQYVHLLAFDGIGLPTDLWLPTTDKVKPQDSWQAVLGYALKLSKTYNLTVEAYYRGMSNLISYREGSGLFQINDWQERITQGSGTSKGLEVFLQKKTGQFTGWIGYTLSYTDRQFDDLNSGQRFPYRYDRRHDISVVASYEIGPRITVSATWVYGTGNAITLANNQFIAYHPRTLINENFASFFAEDALSRNNFRMRAYHRGDISFNFSKQKRKHKRTWSFGAYNVYNNKNPFFLTSDSEAIYDDNGQLIEEKFVLKQQNLFPIIPFVNYKFEF